MAGLLWHTYRAIRQLESSMSALELGGMGPGTTPYEAVSGSLREVWREVGWKRAKETIRIAQETIVSRLDVLGLVYAGRSPGFTREELKDAVVTVWLDSEEGFMAEARFTPKSPPIYQSLTKEEAVSFITGEEPQELIVKVFTPDPYIGE